MVALFMLALAATGVFGGPLSGWILHEFNGVAGLNGWRMLFLMEGIPSIVLGLCLPRGRCCDGYWRNACVTSCARKRYRELALTAQVSLDDKSLCESSRIYNVAARYFYARSFDSIHVGCPYYGTFHDRV
jgi:MFS family permease